MDLEFPLNIATRFLIAFIEWTKPGAETRAELAWDYRLPNGRSGRTAEKSNWNANRGRDALSWFAYPKTAQVN